MNGGVATSIVAPRFARAACETCDWQAESMNPPDALPRNTVWLEAYAHARDEGHTVYMQDDETRRFEPV